MRRRTAATAAPGRHVVKRRMSVGDAMMLGRGRCREGGTENNRSGKRQFCRPEHFRVSLLSFTT